ncbi:hypothetical protein [Bacillus sp. FJAT-52991]|uniref:Phage tail tape measure protein n=1 Tax=Bacillus kandeliae TaxID=3129297 RepID=A0ABZ2N969_9BACI
MMDLTAVIRLNDQMSGKLRRIQSQMKSFSQATNQTASTTAQFASSLPAMASGASVATAALAPLAAAAGGLASSLAAAGAGAVAFGVVATSVLGDIFDAAKEVDTIQEKIDKATTADARIKAQEELAAVYGDLSKAQAGALKDLQDFKAFWGDFTQQFESPIFEAFGSSLNATKGLLKGLEPTISSVATVVAETMEKVNKSMDSPAMKEFFGWLESNAARSLTNFATIAGNTFHGLIGVLQAFAPTGASVEESLVKMSESFREWGQSLSESDGFQKFIEYAKQTGPVLMEVFGNIASIIGQTVEALAPLGAALLSGIAKFTGFIKENFALIRPIIIGAATAFLAFKAVSVIIPIIQGAIAVFNGLKTALTFVKTGFTLVRIAMLLFPGAWIVVAIGAVVAAGIALYKNWDKVKAMAERLVSAVKSGWDKLLKWTKDVFGKLPAPIQSALKTAGKAVKSFFSPMLNFLDLAKEGWKKLTSLVKNFKVPKIKWPSPPSWMSGGGGGDGAKGKGNFHGLSNVPYNGYTTALHKGEMVLNRKEANAYRQGSTGGNVINLTVHYNGGGSLTEQEMHRFSNFLIRQIEQAEGV